MKKIKVFLTGGSGFIGRNFFAQRKNRYDIIAPPHKKLNLLNTKEVELFFRKNKFDIVLHCASIGGLRSDPKPKSHISENIRIFYNIVRNKSKFARMINLGSGAEYDKSRNIKKIEETLFGELIPYDDYGFYKYVCSKYIEKATDITSLRLFGVFGFHEDYRVKFISNLVCKYIFHEPLRMIQNAYFDYVYIDDLIAIIDHFIVSNPHEKFYNIGTGRKMSLLSIAKKINRLGAYSLPIVVQKKGLNKEYTCDNKRLTSEMKGFAFASFEESLGKLYAIYLKNIHSLDERAVVEDRFNKL